MYELVHSLKLERVLSYMKNTTFQNLRIALVGKGAVGKSIYDALHQSCESIDVFDSSNIQDAFEQQYDLLIYAGVPGVKYVANANPSRDLEAMYVARDNISSIKATRKILISTIDAAFPFEHHSATAYGNNRRFLETLLIEHCQILRLPSLFGKHVCKNSWYDLMKDSFPATLDDSYFDKLRHELQAIQEADKSYSHFSIEKDSFSLVHYKPSKDAWSEAGLGLHIAVNPLTTMFWCNLASVGDALVYVYTHPDLVRFTAVSLFNALENGHAYTPMCFSQRELNELFGKSLPKYKSSLPFTDYSTVNLQNAIYLQPCTKSQFTKHKRKGR